MKTIKTTARISRVNCSHDPDYIEISILDQDARLKLANLKLPMDKFAELVTGMSLMDLDCETQSYDYRLGRKRISKKITHTVPFDEWLNASNKERATWMRERFPCPEGWQINPYTDGQGQVSTNCGEGTATIRYSVYNWVDPE